MSRNRRILLLVAGIIVVCIICFVAVSINNRQDTQPVEEVAEQPAQEEAAEATATPDTEATIAAAVEATQAAQPTDTTEATATPEPPTPTTVPPTATPVPPTATPTIIDEYAIYGQEVGAQLGDLGPALSELGELLISSTLTDWVDDDWKLQVAVQIATVQLTHEALTDMDVPPDLEGFHALVLDGTGDCDTAMGHLITGLDNLDAASLETATEFMTSCGEKLGSLNQQITTVESIEELAALPTITPTPIPPTPVPIPPTNTPVPPTPLPKSDDIGVAKVVGNWQMAL